MESPDCLVRKAGWLSPSVLLAGGLILYFAALLFVIPGGAKYHGDEQFYTDAAMRMCDTSDYWTPYFADGRIRLLKPILTYWAVLASFKSFGVSLLSSRLPSMLAGACSLLMTYVLGRTVTRSARTGVLAALLLASNIEFLTLSGRATPDALVTLWVLVSLAGFAKVWFDDRPSLAGPMLAWIGIGFAVQTKGLLGLCPLAANLVFLIFARPDQLGVRARRLADWRALPLGIAIALSWYLVMVKIHGAGALRDFFDDQVAAKVSLNPGFILHNFFTYSMAGIRYFMPWTLLVIAGLLFGREALKSFWRDNRRECIFLIALFPLLVFAFSFGNTRTSRYVMVSYPGLAVLLAGALDSCWSHHGLQLALKRIIAVISTVLLLVATCGILLSYNYGWRLGAAGTSMMVLGFFGFVVRKPGVQIDARWCWLAALMIVLFGTFDGAIRPLSTPTPFNRIALAIAENGGTGKDVFTFQVEEVVASQVRLAAHNTVAVKSLSRSNFTEPRLILTTASAKEKLGAGNYDFRKIEMDQEAVKVRNAMKRYRRTDPGRNTAGRNTEYWLAIRKSDSVGSRP